LPWPASRNCTLNTGCGADLLRWRQARRTEVKTRRLVDELGRIVGFVVIEVVRADASGCCSSSLRKTHHRQPRRTVQHLSTHRLPHPRSSGNRCCTTQPPITARPCLQLGAHRESLNVDAQYACWCSPFPRKLPGAGSKRQVRISTAWRGVTASDAAPEVGTQSPTWCLDQNGASSRPTASTKRSSGGAAGRPHRPNCLIRRHQPANRSSARRLGISRWTLPSVSAATACAGGPHHAAQWRNTTPAEPHRDDVRRRLFGAR
jgi:hypothetical protein